jgi:hypothetical protein
LEGGGEGERTPEAQTDLIAEAKEEAVKLGRPTLAAMIDEQSSRVLECATGRRKAFLAALQVTACRMSGMMRLPDLDDPISFLFKMTLEYHRGSIPDPLPYARVAERRKQEAATEKRLRESRNRHLFEEPDPADERGATPSLSPDPIPPSDRTTHRVISMSGFRPPTYHAPGSTWELLGLRRPPKTCHA